MDRFETEARGITGSCALRVECDRESTISDPCPSCALAWPIADALRDTDARAREEERERCAGICHAHVLAMDEQYKSARTSLAKRLSAIGQMAAAEILRDRIREGAGECGTCHECGGSGEIQAEGPAPDDVRTFRCPNICQGGDDA